MPKNSLTTCFFSTKKMLFDIFFVLLYAFNENTNNQINI